MRSNIPRLNRLLAAVHIGAVQVGARGGFTDDLAPIAAAIDATAFEADRIECDQLAEDTRQDTNGFRTLRYLPLAIGPAAPQRPLNLYRERSWSSLAAADADLAKTYARGSVFALEEQTPVEIVPLDEAAARHALAGVHFLKIAAAALPRQVLGSGPKLVAELCALRVGVTFAPLYQDEPLFGDIDAELRAQGFALTAFTELNAWRRGTDAQADRWSGGATPISEAQPICAEALYVRRPEHFSANTAAEQDRLIAYALIAFAYGQLDLCATVLMRPAIRQRVLELCAIDVSVLLRDLGRWHAKRRRRRLGAAIVKQLGDYLRLSGR